MKENDIPDNRCRYLGHIMWMGDIIQWSCTRPHHYDKCPYVGRDGLFCPLNDYKEDTTFKDALKAYKLKYPDSSINDAVRYVDKLIRDQAVKDVRGSAKYDS